MEQNKILKSAAFGGFEKKSVLNYIDELTTKSSNMENSLNDKIKEISQANDELSKQVQDFNNIVSSLEKQLKDEREKISELTGEIDQLNLNMLEQKKTEHELKKELQINSEQNRILTDKLKIAEAKAGRFDETAINVGSLMIDAKTSAQKIIDKAMLDANDIKKTTSKNIENISSEIVEFKKDVDNLRSTVNTVVGSISSRLDMLVSSIDEIEKRCNQISSTAETKDDDKEKSAKDEKQNEHSKEKPIAQAVKAIAGEEKNIASKFQKIFG